MKKDISMVRKGLVIEVGRFVKSHIKGWVSIYSIAGERIGGFNLLDNRLQVIHKFEQDGTLFLTYALIDKEVN